MKTFKILVKETSIQRKTFLKVWCLLVNVCGYSGCFAERTVFDNCVFLENALL